MTQETQTGALNNLEGRDGEGKVREVQEGGDICVPIHVDTWQNKTKFCKASVLQLKGKKE